MRPHGIQRTRARAPAPHRAGEGGPHGSVGVAGGGGESASRSLTARRDDAGGWSRSRRGGRQPRSEVASPATTAIIVSRCCAVPLSPPPGSGWGGLSFSPLLRWGGFSLRARDAPTGAGRPSSLAVRSTCVLPSTVARCGLNSEVIS